MTVVKKRPEEPIEYQNLPPGSPRRAGEDMNCSQLTGPLSALDMSESGSEFNQPTTPRENPLCTLMGRSSAGTPELPSAKYSAGVDNAEKGGADPRQAAGLSATLPAPQAAHALTGELAALRKEFADQVREFSHRIAVCEKDTGGPPEPADAREEHLAYLRKWMETIVTSVCLAHPTATDVSFLLQDFQARLRRIVPDNYDELKLMDDDKMHQSPNVMSPISRSHNFPGSDSPSETKKCCIIS
ncbi:hypothetical protein DIPPA_07624 [Diplonema papillatum]|nr:hypothetical protein DIPPA_07624 [Diplonema papillatum]